MMNLIDTHAHLDDEKYALDISDVIKRAYDNGVVRIISCGCDLKSSVKSVRLASEYESVFASVGIHPHDAKNADDKALETIRGLICCEKVIAIGEIGLDYYYNYSPRDAQISCLRRHIELAVETNYPIILHFRDAMEDGLNILSDYSHVNGVLHYFSGDVSQMETLTGMGYYFGVDGPITFKKSEQMQEVVKAMPLDRILLETDSPYLTPVPYRGKRNEPEYVSYVLKKIAQIKDLDENYLSEVIYNNTYRLFSRMI